MNYSQNTGSTNSTKELLCVWLPKELLSELKELAYQDCTTLESITRNSLEKFLKETKN